MPVEALSLEALKRCNGSGKLLSKLVLDDRVNDCVRLGVRISNVVPIMKVADQSDPLTFIEGEPFLCVRVRRGVVSLHVQEPFRITITRSAAAPKRRPSQGA